MQIVFCDSYIEDPDTFGLRRFYRNYLLIMIFSVRAYPVIFTK